MAGSTAAHEEDNVKLLFFFLWLQRGGEDKLTAESAQRAGGDGGAAGEGKR